MKGETFNQQSFFRGKHRWGNEENRGNREILGDRDTDAGDDRDPEEKREKNRDFSGGQSASSQSAGSLLFQGVRLEYSLKS